MYNTDALYDAIIEACRDENLYYRESEGEATQRALHIEMTSDNDDAWSWRVTLTRVPNRFVKIDAAREIYIPIGEPFDAIDYRSEYVDYELDPEDSTADIDLMIETELSAQHINMNVGWWVAHAATAIQDHRRDKAARSLESSSDDENADSCSQ